MLCTLITSIDSSTAPYYGVFPSTGSGIRSDDIRELQVAGTVLPLQLRVENRSFYNRVRMLAVFLYGGGGHGTTMALQNLSRLLGWPHAKMSLADA